MIYGTLALISFKEQKNDIVYFDQVELYKFERKDQGQKMKDNLIR